MKIVIISFLVVFIARVTVQVVVTFSGCNPFHLSCHMASDPREFQNSIISTWPARLTAGI